MNPFALLFGLFFWFSLRMASEFIALVYSILCEFLAMFNGVLGGFCVFIRERQLGRRVS